MNELKLYIEQTLGAHITIAPIPRQSLGNLPMYMLESYHLYNAELIGQPFILVKLKNDADLSLLFLEKHFRLLKSVFDKKIALLIESLASFNRKRLIEKGINFIVPGKQLYLPDFLIDLRENFQNPKVQHTSETLIPSAQFLLIYHIIHRHGPFKLEKQPFYKIAKETQYSTMAITNAVENLKHLEMVEVTGTKEKQIRFKLERHELWNDAVHRKLLVNPVLKRVYSDIKPANVYMLPANASALPAYSNMNPSRQQYYAIDKSVFYGLVKSNQFKNLNNQEGNYCIEVWKYNPETLVAELPNETSAVDPLSLYLSLKDSHNERIEMALEQIIEKFIW